MRFEVHPMSQLSGLRELKEREVAVRQPPRTCSRARRLIAAAPRIPEANLHSKFNQQNSA